MQSTQKIQVVLTVGLLVIGGCAEDLSLDLPSPATSPFELSQEQRVALRENRIARERQRLASTNTTSDEVARHRLRWKSLGIGRYQFAYSPGGPHKVTVCVGEGPMRGIFFPGFDVEESIDDLFDRIEDALDADRILVAFDEERGFPTRMQVDPSIIITGAHLDDRYGFSVSDFREGPCDAR